MESESGLEVSSPEVTAPFTSDETLVDDGSESEFVDLGLCAGEEIPFEGLPLPPQSFVSTEVTAAKSGIVSLPINETQAVPKTGEETLPSCEVISSDLHSICNVDTNDSRNDYPKKEAHGISNSQSNGDAEECLPKKQPESGIGPAPKLVASFTPLDRTYVEAIANRKPGDIFFMDKNGVNNSALGISCSSDPVIVDLAVEDDDIFMDKTYRDHSDSSVSDLSNVDSDSDIEIEMEEIFRKGPHLKKSHEATTKGELTLKDLPPIQDLKISVPEGSCLEVGTVTSIVNELVVIQALPNKPALDLGTILFMENGKEALGEVFDVFGQVKEPHYSVRFNSEEHARKRGVKEGMTVFCAPKTDYTSYVFVHDMIKMKGSDASWEHNHEPPLNCLDFSDDEEERAARRRKANPSKDGKITSSTEIYPGRQEVYQHRALNKSHPSLPQESSVTSPSVSDHHQQNMHSAYGEIHQSSISGARKEIGNGAGSLHPPGHPPLKQLQASGWFESDSALRSARRRSLHLYRDFPELNPLLKEVSNPVGAANIFSTPPAMENTPQGPKFPLISNPPPIQQRRPPLLPPPLPIASWPRQPNPFTPTPSDPPRRTSFRLPPPVPYVGQSFYGPPRVLRSIIMRSPCTESVNTKPSPLIPQSPSAQSPINGSGFRNPFSAPQPPSTSAFVFGSQLERRNSIPPPFPPPSHPPFISHQSQPYILRPSSLFTNSYNGAHPSP